jgi:ribonuclease P protein component
MNQQFPRVLRLSRRNEFRRAFRLRCSAGDSTLLIFGYPNGLGLVRLGLSVSRKVGPAVVRNRWKRRIREAFRFVRGQISVGIDLVVIPRDQDEPDLSRIEQSLARLAARLAKRLLNA